jgi:hypothetical protein
MTIDRPGGWLRRQIDFLGSGRLAVALLAVLALLLTVYLLVPQLDPNLPLPEGVESETGSAGRLVRALQLDDVQHSWLLYATYGLIFVNLLLCIDDHDGQHLGTRSLGELLELGSRGDVEPALRTALRTLDPPEAHA